MTDERHPAVLTRDLRVVRGGNEILRGVDLRVPTGQIFGLLGPSGAGKTTLMRGLIGLQRYAGEAQVLGERAGAASNRPRIGYMAQAGAIYSDLSVLDNLRFFGRVFGAKDERVQQVLDMMQMRQFASRLAWRLSGGQQRRVSLGCAIVGEPDLMILDEPTVGLDPVLRVEFWNAFRDWARAGTTLIVSSHVMDEAERCDELVLLRDGSLLAEGSPSELLERTGSEKMETAFLRLAGASPS